MPRRKEPTPEIKSLGHLSRAVLRALWTKEFNDSPPACLGRDILASSFSHTRVFPIPK
jgi:hypothetical protein